MSNPIEIKKSEMENYVIEWEFYENYAFLSVKVVRVFKKKGEITRRKYKNMITSPGIDLTQPDAEQKSQLRQAKQAINEVAKAMKAAMKSMPKKKVEF